jgi:hypothetical protein
MKKQFGAGFCVLTLGTLACQPVIAIGWREGLVILIVMAVLLGPPVYRFLRRIENLRRKRDQ